MSESQCRGNVHPGKRVPKIRRWALLLLGSLILGGVIEMAAQSKPRVTLRTSKGDIVVELDADRAPATVENFLSYVKAGFYEGTVFHRVIDGFMIQGGGFSAEMVQKTTGGAIRNEANNGLKNERGAIAMARRPDPHSATSQFFINTTDNAFLDHQSESPKGWGYAVFGRVLEGFDVVDAIAKVETGSRAGMSDVPKEPVVILEMSLEGQ